MPATFITDVRHKFLACISLIAVLSLTTAAAGLSQKQARKLISRIAGAQLPSDAVRVRSVTEQGDKAEALVEIETAFRFVQNDRREWQVAEVRIGPERWEEIPLIAGALSTDVPAAKCTGTDFSAREASTDPTPKRARCMIASLLKIGFPSDAVRIREISPSSVPFATRSSALVVAIIQGTVGFSKEKTGWRVSGVRTGSGDWVGVEAVAEALNDNKRKRAQAELTTLAEALEHFRKDHGFYVVSDKEPVLVDHLSPRYLGQIIRLDPWNNPYQYQGERDHFVLRSKGPDGKENTSDDVIVSGPSATPPN